MKLLLVATLALMTTACATSNHQGNSKGDTPLEVHFEEIKGNTPRLVNFLDKFPKGADLHNHASGAVYIEHALVYAKEKAYLFDIDQLEVVREDKSNKDKTFIAFDKVEKESAGQCLGYMKDRPCLTTIDAALNNKALMQNFLDVVSIRGWHAGTSNGQDHFFNAFSHARTPYSKSHYLAGIIARNHSQGVRYLELMTTSVPGNVDDPARELLPKEYFDIKDLEKAYTAIAPHLHSESFQLAINAHMNNREKNIEAVLNDKYTLTHLGERPDVVVRYIPQLYRSQDLYNIFINAAVNLKASTLDDRIVATNMVTNEAAIGSMQDFEAQMQILDFLWNKLNKPQIALHAGELVLRESPLEPMRDRISKSISVGHASRIGHGISIAWEHDSKGTLDMMREQEVAVEICLSSNEIILGVAGKDHPLAMYREAGVAVTLSTDDEAISRSNLTMEYVKAAQDLDLGYNYLKEIAKNGLKFSFLEGPGIYNKHGEIMPEFENALSGELAKVSDLGVKAYLQIRHERDLEAFESALEL